VLCWTPTVESERMHPRVVLYDYIMKHVGLPYRWGGDDPINGYDCSGLVLEFLRAAGAFPRAGDLRAQDLFNKYEPAEEPDFGILAFYGKSSVEISHVGFCVSKKQMVEAGGGGSKTLTEEDAAKQNAYVMIRPINSRKDFIGFRKPYYPWKG
jgi:cell wall-associated NlpC family hydrolase